MSIKNSQLLPKLLSHRLRGFAEVDHAFSGLTAACTSRAKYLELDLRLSRDGTFFIYHDATTGADVDRTVRISERSDDDLRLLRLANGEALMTLDVALKQFVHLRQPGQKLVLDIKDFGGEDALATLIRANDAEEFVVICTWIPQVIYKISDLDLKCPRIFAHWNLLRLGVFGRWLTSIFRNSLLPLGKFAIIGVDRLHADLNELSIGYQHTVGCMAIPDDLLGILRKSSGGICVHRSIASRCLKSYCRDESMQLWVYEVDTLSQFDVLSAADDIDVIFCNSCNI